jgi:cystathionine beta-lyase/cystathionine gamma-synthase
MENNKINLLWEGLSVRNYALKIKDIYITEINNFFSFDTLVRFEVGIEDVEDIFEDIQKNS